MKPFQCLILVFYHMWPASSAAESNITIDIYCSNPFLACLDAVICKWMYQGVEFEDVYTMKTNDCKLINMSLIIGLPACGYSRMNNTCNRDLVLWNSASSTLSFYANGTVATSSQSRKSAYFICQTNYPTNNAQFNCLSMSNRTSKIVLVNDSSPTTGPSTSTTINTETTSTQAPATIGTISPASVISIETSSTHATIAEDWSQWYTKSCFVKKRRRNIANGSFQVVIQQIGKLTLCDNLDKSFTAWKYNLYDKQRIHDLEDRENETSKILHDLDVKYANWTVSSTSFAWLTIAVISILLFLAIFNDSLSLLARFHLIKFTRFKVSGKTKRKELSRARNKVKRQTVVNDTKKSLTLESIEELDEIMPIRQLRETKIVVSTEKKSMADTKSKTIKRQNSKF